MKLFNDIGLAARIALRDMRGGMRSLALLVAGVFVGAAAVALVGTASQSLIDASRQGAFEAVGGDISLRLFHSPPSKDQLAHVRALSEMLSMTAELRPMVRGVRALDGSISKPTLVELKGVDLNYPLYGDVRLEPNFNLYQTLNRQGSLYGAVADQSLFDALGLEPGDSLQIGAATYQLRGVLVQEPDRAFRAFTLGPRVMVLHESFPITGIVEDGAEVYYYTRAKLPQGADAQAALDSLDQAFPNAGWRMVNAHAGVPGVERSLAIAHVLLLFIGLGVMLVGGAGISGAVRAHIQAKMQTIAILKSIGTPPGVVMLAVGMQAMAAAALGAIIGVGLGAMGPKLVLMAMGDQLPFAVQAMPALKPLVAAVSFGVLVAAVFAWWPLMSVKDMSARILLRERARHTPGRAGGSVWAGVGVLIAMLLALVFWASPMPVLTAVFLVGALVLAAIYHALGRVFARVARSLAPGRSAGVRLALGNLYRAGAPTQPVVMALGLTLTLLIALDGIGQAASRHVGTALPQSAPDLVAFSLKTQQAHALQSALDTWGGVERMRVLPFLHARVQAINAVPVRDLKIPASLGWVVRGDRGVSFADDQPQGGTIAAGSWWDDPTQPALSVDAGVAQKLGLKLGDTLTLNVSGHVVTAPIFNLRTIDWTGLDLDFPIIASPGALSHVPHTFAVSLKARGDLAADLETFVKDRFPDVPLIRVKDVLAALAVAVAVIVTGLEAAALLCGAAALIVLAGSVMQGLSERRDEAMLFKVLGARRTQLMGQLAVEFLSLGLLVALAAVPLGVGVAFAVAKAAGLDAPDMHWSGPAALVGASLAVTVVTGLAVTLSAYLAAPAAYLRNRGL